jgi:hypothetical protein
MGVYLIRYKRLTKIGITGNLPQRLSSIRTRKKSARVFLYFPLFFSRQIERKLHSMYDHLRRPQNENGGTEWFAVHPLRPAFWLVLYALYQLFCILAILCMLISIIIIL